MLTQVCEGDSSAKWDQQIDPLYLDLLVKNKNKKLFLCFE